MKLRKKTNWRPYLETLEARRLLSVYADFNGDGRDDLAIGVPLEDIGTIAQAGAVHVIYGSASGLTSAGNQFWHQDSVNILDTAEQGDNFGSALAGGDFNSDGFADLAIGIPLEDISPATNAGAIQVLYGSATGLTDNDLFLHQDSNKVRETGETGDNFGSALATGDFNGDSFTDLVVGVPGEGVGTVARAGGIHVFYGTPTGLTPRQNQPFNLDSGGMNGVAGESDEFGSALAAGDFNGDGKDDVAIGVRHAEISNQDEAGAVSIMYGSALGLQPPGNQFWHQESSGIADTAEEFDQFGTALAAGDFNGDSRSDLAIGVPFEDVDIFGTSEGFVHVLYGSAAGVTASGSIAFDQGDVGGNPQNLDFFGLALTAASFNGDGAADLAISAPNEDIGFNNSAGVVHVVFGGSGGINTNTAVEITQETMGTGDASEDDDQFGRSLAAGDFNGNGKADLAIGAPFEDIGTTVIDTGRVSVLYGGTSFGGGQQWGQDSTGILDVSETGDFFGGGLDAGGGKSAPGGGSGRRDLAHLISADLEFDSLLTKPNKRRLLNGRR